METVRFIDGIRKRFRRTYLYLTYLISAFDFKKSNWFPSGLVAPRHRERSEAHLDCAEDMLVALDAGDAIP